MCKVIVDEIHLGNKKFEGSMWWETKVSIGDNALALVIRKGVQFPDNSKYLFDGYNGIIEIYPDIDVSNIISAECMFANTEKANPNTANWSCLGIVIQETCF